MLGGAGSITDGKCDGHLKRALETGLGGNGIRSVTASTDPCTVLVLFAPAHPLAEIEQRVRQVVTRAPEDRTGALSSEGPAWHSMDADSVLGALDSSPEGLETGAAGARLRRYGPNALERMPPRSGLETFAAQFANLPVALLAGSAVLSLAAGGLFDAAVVLAVIGLNGFIGSYSETWTEQTIASLEQEGLPPARAFRDGLEADLPTEDLVPGDVIVLGRDQRIPPDARVIAADRLTVNELSLTGESVPVPKAPNVLAASRTPLSGRHNHGVSRLDGDRRQPPRRRRRDRRAHRDQPGAGVADNCRAARDPAATATAFAGAAAGHQLGCRGGPDPVARIGARPGFSADATLAVGAGRLAKQDLLVRRLQAIETLGRCSSSALTRPGR